MKNKQIKKGIFFSLLVGILVGMTWTSAAGENTAVPPIEIRRPQGTNMQQMQKALLWLVSNLKSANFTPDNVYYGVYNNLGSYNYPIDRSTERNISFDLSAIVRGINTTLTRLQSDVSTEPAVLTYLNTLISVLMAHDSLVIYDKVETDLLITTTHDRKAVTIFYDNDESVLQAIDKIKNNESIDSQPFTGDEILSNVYMSLVHDEIVGSYEVWNEWTFEDGSDATILKEFISRLTSNRWLTRELRFLFGLRPINILQTLVAPSHKIFSYTSGSPKVLTRSTFEISQLQIDELTLRKIGNNLVVQEYDYKYLEHHLLGTLVYNDSNENGLMDIGVRTASIGNYNIAYPTIGDEAKFRFDMKNIGTRTYQSPTTTGNILEFGASYDDVQGYLQPLARNQDLSILNESQEVHTIDEVSTLFHFSVDNTEGTIILKFDYIIGEWDNAADLQGLSLNQLMTSTVVDAKKSRLFQWRVENDTELTDENANATRISKFRFTNVEDSFGEIRLDDIPYYWGDTAIEVNAVGQLIPLNLIDVTYGRISSDADTIRSFAGSTERKTFLYSVSYPKWDGLKIVHDPSYVVAGGLGASDTLDTDTGIIPGFEIVVAVLTVTMFTFIHAYRRKRG